MVVVLLIATVLLHVLAFGRDLLLAHEAARAGARAAATSLDEAEIAAVARAAAEGLSLQISVQPSGRRAGDLAEVTVSWTARLGPLEPTVEARAVARTEPGVAP